MNIHQFYDRHLAHASYAIEHNGQVALIDPGRNPKPYADFARQHSAEIVAVLETHPHADFVSSHLEWQKQGATVYIHPDVGVAYKHTPVVDGDIVKLEGVYFKTLFTPGHSPDHNSYLLFDEQNKPVAVFTGDSLFIGDVGRPDLREGAGNLKSLRADLARQMYHTIHDVFAKLEDDIIVYPAHGAGSLCGKNMSTETSSTMGQQKMFNWAFHIKDQEEFIAELTGGQPYVPKYFPYDVETNRVGAPDYNKALAEVPKLANNTPLDKDILVVDIRKGSAFRQGHLPGSLNVPNSPTDKFESWVGTIVAPETPFYLLGDDQRDLENATQRLAKIGYERFIKAMVMYDMDHLPIQSLEFDETAFRSAMEDYRIIDIRNESEVETSGPIFNSAHNIQLADLWDSAQEIPNDKPVVVHCSAGYRSAIGVSILEILRPDLTVYELGESIKTYKTVKA